MSAARPADVILCTASRHVRPAPSGEPCELAAGCPEPGKWIIREGVNTGCTTHMAAWIRRTHPAREV